MADDVADDRLWHPGKILPQAADAGVAELAGAFAGNAELGGYVVERAVLKEVDAHGSGLPGSQRAWRYVGRKTYLRTPFCRT